MFKIPKSSACVVISPPLVGKKELLFRFVADSLENKEPVLFIISDSSPEALKKELLQEKIFFKPELLRFVDCYSYHSGNSNVKDTNDIKRVSGPLAFNEISIAIHDIERKFLRQGSDSGHKVLFSSLSTLLMYSNAGAVSRFLQVLIAKIKNLNGSVIFTLEEGMHDEKTIVTIEHLMDVIISLKKEKGKVLFMARGIKGFDKWTAL